MLGISGLIGGGAAQGLEELLARQLLEAQQAERERATRAQEGLAGRRLDQDAAQHADRVRLDQAGLDQRASEFDAETQQGAMDALRADRDRMDARLTRLTKEDDTEALIATLEQMQGLTPGQRTAAMAAARGGRDINPGDLVTEDERQRRRKETLSDEITLARERERAQQDFTERDPSKGANGTFTDAGAIENANEVARLAEALKSHRGFASVFGTMQGAMPSMRQDSVDAEAIRDRLISSLTLENIGKLKGVLSDRDMQVLREAATSLRPRMGDAAAAAELDRIIAAMQRRGRPTMAPSHSGGGGESPTIRYERVNGKLVRVGG